MVKVLSRAQLYEMVWSQPRTKLAKELGISDVAIAKHCKRAHIPAPPAGYWARIDTGRRPARPPLPVRLPGQAEMIALGVVHVLRHWPSDDDMSKPLVAPAFVEDVDAQVADAMKRIGRVTASRDLSTPDGALTRVLAAEAKRSAKHAQHSWSFDKPYFDEPASKRQMRIFNGLARALRPVYGAQDVRCHDHWIQGHGNLHLLELHLEFGSAKLTLEFQEPGQRSPERTAKSVSATTLRVGAETARLGIQEWTDLDGSRLEEQLPAILAQLLRRAELTLRNQAQYSYEHQLERRQARLEEIAEEERAARQRRMEEVAAHAARFETRSLKSLDADARQMTSERQWPSCLDIPTWRME